jgi:hypothetical protein
MHLPTGGLADSAGEPMTYRAYLIGPDDRIRTVELIEAEDDETAVETARPMGDGDAIEVWERGRLIARLDPKPAQP